MHLLYNIIWVEITQFYALSVIIIVILFDGNESYSENLYKKELYNHSILV